MLINSVVGNILLGVIAAAIAATMTYVGRSIVLPRIQSSLMSEVTVTGVWQGLQCNPRGTFGFRLELRQSGSKVRGTFYSDDEVVGGKRRTRLHIIEGEVHYGHLCLTYRNKDQRSMGMGSFLFAIRQGGDELVGHMLFLQTGTGSIRSSEELVLERQ